MSDDAVLVQAPSRVERKRAWSTAAPDVAELSQLSEALAAPGVLDGNEDDEGEEDVLLGTRRPRAMSAADGVPLERAGFLWKRSGALSGTHRRFFMLPPCGTLLWYKAETDAEPTGWVHLGKCSSIVGHDRTGTTAHRRLLSREGSGRPGLTLRSSKEYTLMADDEEERDAWLRALQHNRSLPPMADLDAVDGGPMGSEADALPAARKPPRGLFPARLQERMACMAVTSELGKKLLRAYCNTETFALLQALRNIANKDDTLPVKSGLRFENTILRTAVRVALLQRNGSFRGMRRELEAVEGRSDAACIALVRAHRSVLAVPAGHTAVSAPRRGEYGDVDGLSGSHTDGALDGGSTAVDDGASTAELLGQLSCRLAELETSLLALLAPFLTLKAAEGLREMTRHFASLATLGRITGEEAFADDVAVIACAIECVYGLRGEARLEGEDEPVQLRSCMRVKDSSPPRFRLVVLGLPVGATAFGVLPCCGSVIQIEVERRARCILFPQSPACRETCGAASETPGS